MKKAFFKTKEAIANNSGAMKRRPFIKNKGRSLKSLTSRGKIILFVCISILFASCRATVQTTYIMPNADAYTTQHKTLAILPVEKNIIETKHTKKLKNKKDMTNIDISVIQEDMRNSINEFVKEGKMNIEVQNIKNTNAILEGIGYFEGKTTNMPPEELAKILGVDAVLGTNFKLTAGKNVGLIVCTPLEAIPLVPVFVLLQPNLTLLGLGFYYGLAVTIFGIINLSTVHEYNEIVFELYDGKTGDFNLHVWEINYIEVVLLKKQVLPFFVWKKLFLLHEKYRRTIRKMALCRIV
jgi:hypothetical protein